MANDPALPSFERPEFCAIAPDLDLIADLLGGTRRMHQQSNIGSGSEAYIRKWKDEDQSVYDIRRKGETVFEGLTRTLSAGVGMLFAKPPTLTWNASEGAMTDQWANIDAGGTSGPVFVKRFSESSIRDGLGLILVDHPTPPAVADGEGKPRALRADESAALGLRPTWAAYGRKQVINWRTTKINNQTAFNLVVLHECANLDNGEYGTVTVDRYRVLRLILTPDGYQAVWTLWEIAKDAQKSESGNYKSAGSGVFKNEKGAIADFLPVAVAYTGRSDAPMTATIPLLGVAWANLAHWQLSTDLRFYRSLSAFPQPVLIGNIAPTQLANGTTIPGVMRFGPMVAVHLTGDNASYELKELAGTSMAQLESGIQEKLQQMGQQGLSFLVTDTRAAETAEAKRLDATAENSTLATAAQGIDDCINQALEYHAWYLGIAKAGAPVIALNRDFENTVMDAATMTAYVALANAGFPKLLILEALQAQGRIKLGLNLDTLATEWDGAVVAAEAAKADALALAGASAGNTPLDKAA